MDIDNINNYISYIRFLDDKLGRFFEAQKPYICCYKGCGRCCKNAVFPYSYVEVQYLKHGLSKLDIETQGIIKNNIKKAIETSGKDVESKYDCPFLVDNICTVYAYRGIICRAFGLISSTEGNSKVPFCAYEGLNYSSVVDAETNTVSLEKFRKLNIEQEPLSYNVSYGFLTSEKVEKVFGVSFGDKKRLIDWFND